jgi:hypothetical protein
MDSGNKEKPVCKKSVKPHAFEISLLYFINYNAANLIDLNSTYIKKKELELENFILSKVSQVQKVKGYMFFLICRS